MSTPSPEVTIEDGRELVAWTREHEFEFLDFGCSRGGSLQHAKSIFNAQREGLGIDISEKKIRQARAAGCHAVNFDILRIPDVQLVRFVTMMHFLEHTNGYPQARKFIEKACKIAREFVYIAQPYFDADAPLLQHELKLYWSDWVGHTYTMSVLDLYRILRNLLQAGALSNFAIALFQPIRSSEAPEVIPLSTPEDQLAFDPEGHPPKPPRIDFEFPVYREVRAVASHGEEVHRGTMSRIGEHHLLVEGSPEGVQVHPVRW